MAAPPSGPPKASTVPKGESQLDGPPPSPSLDPSTQPGGPNGTQVPQGMAGLAAPMAIPSGQMPPEILTGMASVGEQMVNNLDALAQTAPDLAAECSLISELLRQLLGKLMIAGAQPPSPTAAGTGFPGGGFGGPGM